jgi:DNA-binding transcriptional LysR family regulator
MDERRPRIPLGCFSPIETLGNRSNASPVDVSLPDLANHLQIVLADPTHLSEGRSFGVLSPQTCRVSSHDTKHSVILADLGWGCVPLWQVDFDLGEGRLVRLATNALGLKRKVASEAYLAHRVDEPLGPAAQIFREALVRITAARTNGGLGPENLTSSISPRD